MGRVATSKLVDDSPSTFRSDEQVAPVEVHPGACQLDWQVLAHIQFSSRDLGATKNVASFLKPTLINREPSGLVPDRNRDLQLA
jgi:hypothetical protein